MNNKRVIKIDPAFNDILSRFKRPLHQEKVIEVKQAYDLADKQAIIKQFDTDELLNELVRRDYQPAPDDYLYIDSDQDTIDWDKVPF